MQGWAVTGSSIARFDGAWTVWEQGAGFEDRLSPTAIDVDAAADGSYTVHAAAGFRGIANFVDGSWTLQETSLNGARDLAAADGIVLIPAFREGIVSYEGVAETPFTPADGLSSDLVRGVAIDAAGQQWRHPADVEPAVTPERNGRPDGHRPHEDGPHEGLGGEAHGDRVPGPTPARAAARLSR